MRKGVNPDFFKKIKNIVSSQTTTSSNNPFDDVMNPLQDNNGNSKGGFTKKKQPRDKYGRFIKNITYTPLKISNRTAVETSTKLPVTDLEQAPLRGAVSNLHWYKYVGKL